MYLRQVCKDEKDSLKDLGEAVKTGENDRVQEYILKAERLGGMKKF